MVCIGSSMPAAGDVRGGQAEELFNVRGRLALELAVGRRGASSLGDGSTIRRTGRVWQVQRSRAYRAPWDGSTMWSTGRVRKVQGSHSCIKTVETVLYKMDTPPVLKGQTHERQRFCLIFIPNFPKTRPQN